MVAGAGRSRCVVGSVAVVKRAQTCPGEGAHRCSDLVRVEFGAFVEQPPTCAFGESDEGVGDDASPLRVEVDGDERSDCACRIRGDPSDLFGEFGVMSSCAAEEESEPVMVGCHPSEVCEESEPRLRLSVISIGCRLGNRRSHTGAHLVEERREKVALGIEVLIQHWFGHSGGFSDLVHRGAVIAGASEDLERNVEDLFAPGRGGETGMSHGNVMLGAISTGS